MAQHFTFRDQSISIGDTVRIYQQVAEGESGKTRVQVFEGIVIASKNRGAGQSFTVRRVGAGSIGIEKIIPVNSPSIQKIEVKNKGIVRRSKLYYLRDLVGKAATKIKTQSAVKKTAKAA